VNEDAFTIHHAPVPYAAVADGAGNAERAAKRVLTLFAKLFGEALPGDASKAETWAKWIRLLDSALQGGTQSTFIAVAVIDGVAVGACVGDSKAYVVNRDGECSVLTEGAAKARLGSGRAEAFEINRTLAPGDTLLLLSDGAWTPLGPYLIKKAVVGNIGKHFSELPAAVLDIAGRTGRADDMTCVAVRLVRPIR
jgi:serine/threonine protein phosphatase PrpC